MIWESILSGFLIGISAMLFFLGLAVLIIGSRESSREALCDGADEEKIAAEVRRAFPQKDLFS